MSIGAAIRLAQAKALISRLVAELEMAYDAASLHELKTNELLAEARAFAAPRHKKKAKKET